MSHRVDHFQKYSIICIEKLGSWVFVSKEYSYFMYTVCSYFTPSSMACLMHILFKNQSPKKNYTNKIHISTHFRLAVDHLQMGFHPGSF